VIISNKHSKETISSIIRIQTCSNHIQGMVYWYSGPSSCSSSSGQLGLLAVIETEIKTNFNTPISNITQLQHETSKIKLDRNTVADKLHLLSPKLKKVESYYDPSLGQ